MSQPKATISFKADADDLKLIARLKAKLSQKFGKATNSDLLRMGLLRLAEAEGLRK